MSTLNHAFHMMFFLKHNPVVVVGVSLIKSNPEWEQEEQAQGEVTASILPVESYYQDT